MQPFYVDDDDRKPTRKETIGAPYVWARRLAMVAVALSGVLFAYVSKEAGFWVLFAGYFALNMLENRMFNIELSRQLDLNHESRMKLLDYADHETVITQIAADQMWRKGEVEPKVQEQLESIKARKAALLGGVVDAMNKFAELFNTPKTPPPDDKGN